MPESTLRDPIISAQPEEKVAAKIKHSRNDVLFHGHRGPLFPLEIGMIHLLTRLTTPPPRRTSRGMVRSCHHSVKHRCLGYTAGMRVIAGQFRGRRLRTPTGLDTRPILDRVKVPLFDWLGVRLAEPGTLPPLAVLDVFCGGGSMGIEALSRGARCCVFVDAGREAIDCLKANIATLGIGKEAQVVNRRAESIMVSPPTGPGFDLVFLDPPYRLSEEVSEDSPMGRVTGRLGREIPVASDAFVLWRHDAKTALPDQVPGGWRVVERRTWSSMTITIFTLESALDTEGQS